MKICFAMAIRCRALAGWAMLVAMIGCQSWQSSSVLPGLTATKDERLVVKQAKNDPFPSPSDVGIQGQMTNNE
ncbi:MAG: hypothetical protein GXP28_06675 [Planctomycetes bacterium]|nr:hypothetical protein [Planctomycetota bacterium]